jgi:glycosyltransferase involved in cell wall biosynthesis
VLDSLGRRSRSERLRPGPPEENRLLLSVVIPTRDRCPLLRATVQALGQQRGIEPCAFELVVADDGSADDTARFLGSPPKTAFPIASVRLSGGGPAKARNRAILLSRAPRILLLGDDTLPCPDALAEHLRAAGDRDVGIQGRIEWDPLEPVTPVMRFLAPEGPQFYFKGLRAGSAIPYTAVLASNLSAPRRWFLEEPFDESFPAAAFEDTELAYRWRHRGRRVLFAEKALCHHRHAYATIEPFLDRQRRAGKAARYSVRRHPGMLARTVLTPLAVGAAVAVRHGLRRLAGRPREKDAWDLQARGAFFQGFFDSTSRH